MSSRPPIVLTFAASDPTGGAGLQADLLTLAGMGCHPLSVLTALTVQDTSGVESLHAMDAERVRAQAELVLAETRVAAFKLGVLGSAANIHAVAAILEDHPEVPVVVIDDVELALEIDAAGSHLGRDDVELGMAR